MCRWLWLLLLQSGVENFAICSTCNLLWVLAAIKAIGQPVAVYKLVAGCVELPIRNLGEPQWLRNADLVEAPKGLGEA